jgi:hypothetical protein
LNNIQEDTQDQYYSNSTSDEVLSSDYYKSEDIDVLKEINIDTWKIENKQLVQYYLVKLENNDEKYLLKIISADHKYEFIKIMKDYETEYGKLKEKHNLLSPQYLFKDTNDTICGYLMKFSENIIDLENYVNFGNKIGQDIFISIILGVINCYNSIFSCGLKPCIKNKILIYDSKFGQQILLSDMDELVSCKNDIEEESIRYISKLIDPSLLPRELKESFTFKKIFNLSDVGFALQDKIYSRKALEKIIEEIKNSTDKIES